MVTAFVMIKTDPDRIPESAAQLADLDGVTSVYSVTGNWDLVAMVRLRQFDDLADVIADQMSKVEGIRDTETMLAFRAYSRHDLEEGFALGFENTEQ
ncbi:Lrp/AsnC ligand binding domain-containing protein [Citricoccus nitrophenolicus]|uniref:Lrp/AsnC family transcriptional regulator n=1 Tax=Citricoccus nitrophenolicus TaxID=863575 RepID=UPI0031EE34CE